MKKKKVLESGVENKEDLSNISRVLKETKKEIKSGDFESLGHLSNETIHSAAVNQDPLNIVVAVLVYSLYKVFMRKHYRRMDGWKHFNGVLEKNLDSMISDSEKGDYDSVLLRAGEIRQSLNEIEGDLGVYIKDVFRKAEINKAFKIYEHGISGSKTASLLGVSLWDLASYIGQSTISEAKVSITVPQKERIKTAEDFFG